MVDKKSWDRFVKSAMLTPVLYGVGDLYALPVMGLIALVLVASGLILHAYMKRRIWDRLPNALTLPLLALGVFGLLFAVLQLTVFDRYICTTGCDYYREMAENEQKILERMDETGDLIVLSKDSFEVVRGVEEKFFMGIRNPGSNDSVSCFDILFRCRSAESGSGCDPEGLSADPVDVGGGYPGVYIDFSDNPAQEWFKVFRPVSITGDDTAVYPIFLTVPAAHSDTYLIEAVIFRGEEDCFEGPAWTTTPWRTKQFYVEVT